MSSTAAVASNSSTALFEIENAKVSLVSTASNC